MMGTVLPVTVGGHPQGQRGYILLIPPDERKGVCDMVTWPELLQFSLFVISLISLIVQIIEKKK